MTPAAPTWTYRQTFLLRHIDGELNPRPQADGRLQEEILALDNLRYRLGQAFPDLPADVIHSAVTVRDFFYGGRHGIGTNSEVRFYLEVPVTRLPDSPGAAAQAAGAALARAVAPAGRRLRLAARRRAAHPQRLRQDDGHAQGVSRLLFCRRGAAALGRPAALLPARPDRRVAARPTGLEEGRRRPGRADGAARGRLAGGDPADGQEMAGPVAAAAGLPRPEHGRRGGRAAAGGGPARFPAEVGGTGPPLHRRLPQLRAGHGL